MTIKNSNVLVTGGAGLIGSHLVDILVREYNCRVRILDALVEPTHVKGRKPPWIPQNVEFVLGDIIDSVTVRKALQNIDFVFHLAASGYVANRSNGLQNVFKDATIGTCVIFDVIRQYKLPVKKVVVASSMAVYGCGSYTKKDGTEYIPIRYRSENAMDQGHFDVYHDGHACKPYPIKETRVLEPVYPYSIAKLTQEKIAIAVGREMNLPTVALRYSITYGPRQSLHNPYTGILSVFASNILNGKPPIVFEDGNQLRDFIYVEDVARANIFVMENDKTKWEVYNVASGRGGDTVGKVAEMMCKYLQPHSPRLSPVYNGDYRVFDTRHIVLDPSKLMKLGWKCNIALEEGLKRHAEWVLKYAKSQNVAETFTEAYGQQLQDGVIKRSAEAVKRH